MLDRWECQCCGHIHEHAQFKMMKCHDCGSERDFTMTATQALAVARELNRLETENRGLSQMLAVSTLAVARPHQKQACGHEQRFIVSSGGGTNWCALCEIEGLEQMAAMWAQTLREAKEATDG